MSDAQAHHDAHAGGHHHVNYFAIFIALLVCTAISIVFDLLPKSGNLKYLVVFLVLSVATAKALFVMTYFMHLKFEGGWKFVVLLPTAILSVGMMVALMPDIGLHYYTYDVPQVRDHASGQDHMTPHTEGEHEKGGDHSHK
jgi:cytochrome c oxidase subunit 4